ncbi:MAG: S-methyl-5'-thioadenosine phosphorylase [Planctomycetes bacterium]|nr:S-methyl-5'-thioadenosine phosphorylase [Planctomycetota bacterium]
MIGLIGGTGLGEALMGDSRGTEHVIDTPFGMPSSAIHVVEWNGIELALLARHGEGHTLNPSQVPYRANIYALKKLGVTHIIASGAVGSLRDQIKPRDLMLCHQVIDKTHRRIPTFYDVGLAAHVEFAQPYCPQLRALLEAAASKVNATVHTRGVYVCMEGPAFSTQAESTMHRAWGADVIGMTTMPEAKLAREAEMCYALIALATDYDCWRGHEPGTSKQALLNEIIGNLREATANAVALMRAGIDTFAENPPEPCACHTALDLAVWSDHEKLTEDVRRHYDPLLNRYVEAARAAQKAT